MRLWGGTASWPYARRMKVAESSHQFLSFKGSYDLFFTSCQWSVYLAFCLLIFDPLAKSCQVWVTESQYLNYPDWFFKVSPRDWCYLQIIPPHKHTCVNLGQNQFETYKTLEGEGWCQKELCQLSRQPGSASQLDEMATFPLLFKLLQTCLSIVFHATPIKDNRHDS